MHVVLFFIATIIVLGIVIFKRDGLVLLKDRFSIQKIKEVTVSNYLILLVYTIALAVISWFLFHVIQSFFAYVVSGHLSEFLLNSRAVYSIAAAKNFSFSVNGILMGLIFTPISMFVATYCLMHLIRRLFLSINDLFDDQHAINEKDVNYYTLIGIVCFMMIEFALHYQATNSLTSDINSFYIAIDKYGFLIAFIFMKHSFRLKNDPTYVNALADTEEMKFQKRVFTNQIATLLFAYFIILMLRIPAFFGTQFLVSNWIVIICFVLFLFFISFIYKRLLKNIALLTFQTIANENQIIRVDKRYFEHRVVVISLICFLFLFSILQFKIFFMLVVTSIILLLMVFVLASVFFLFSDFLQQFINQSIDTGFKKLMIVSMARLFIRTSIPIMVMNGLFILFFAQFPKQYQENTSNHTISLVDEAQNVMYVNQIEAEQVCIPLKKVPEFARRMLIAQEDQGFFKQDQLLATHSSNWHGVSYSLYKIIFGSGGGSNINYQILKNNIWPANPPKDVVRKLSESLSSLQLSVQYEPDELLLFYFNGVSFNGGKGGTMGVETAAIYTFGQSFSQCNELQQLFLITSLRSGSTYSLGQDGRINLSEVGVEEVRVKAFLIRRAKELLKDGFLTEVEFRKLKRQDLAFVNAKSYPKHTKAKNLFYKQLITSHEIQVGKHELTLNQKYEDAISNAVQEFREVKRNELRADTGDSLQMACIVVEIETGNILGFYNGDNSQDLVTYENGFPMASTIKPFVLTSVSEVSGVSADQIRLYDGIKQSNVPKNYNNKYSQKEVGIDVIIPQSKNSPMAYIGKYYEPIQVFKDTESKFRAMGIAYDEGLDLDNQNERKNYERNYPLGQRLMQIGDMAKCYSSLLNNGKYVGQTVIETDGFEPIQVFDKTTANQIKEAMHLTTQAGGTAYHLNRYLPRGRKFYAKTGTSENNIHGFCVLADRNIVIVSWASYGRVEVTGQNTKRLELNQTSSLQGGGSSTAGVFAALVMKGLRKDKQF